MLGFDALGKRALGEVPTAAANALIAEAGAFALTGQTIVSTVTMAGETGAYELLGSATFTIVLPMDAGAFTLAGQTALTPAVFTLRCDPYVSLQAVQVGFAPLGAIALGQGYIDTATAISFALTGQEVGFRHTMAAEAGAFVFTGQEVSPFLGNILSPEAGAFALTFQTVASSIVLPLAAGSFVLTGIGQTDLTRRAPKIRAFPRVGRNTATARPVSGGARARAYGG